MNVVHMSVCRDLAYSTWMSSARSAQQSSANATDLHLRLHVVGVTAELPSATRPSFTQSCPNQANRKLLLAVHRSSLPQQWRRLHRRPLRLLVLTIVCSLTKQHTADTIALVSSQSRYTLLNISVPITLPFHPLSMNAPLGRRRSLLCWCWLVQAATVAVAVAVAVACDYLSGPG